MERIGHGRIIGSMGRYLQQSVRGDRLAVLEGESHGVEAHAPPVEQHVLRVSQPAVSQVEVSSECRMVRQSVSQACSCPDVVTD